MSKDQYHCQRSTGSVPSCPFAEIQCNTKRELHNTAMASLSTQKIRQIPQSKGKMARSSSTRCCQSSFLSPMIRLTKQSLSPSDIITRDAEQLNGDIVEVTNEPTLGFGQALLLFLSPSNNLSRTCFC